MIGRLVSGGDQRSAAELPRLVVHQQDGAVAIDGHDAVANRLDGDDETGALEDQPFFLFRERGLRLRRAVERLRELCGVARAPHRCGASDRW